MKWNTTKTYLIKIIEISYLTLGVLIALASLLLGSIILIEIIEQGGLPHEGSPRFLKGIKLRAGLSAFVFIGKASLIWIICSVILFSVFKINFKSKYFLIGFLGVVSSMMLFYFLLYSESGKWILN